ncbi:MAG: DUF1727 domain-containing protein [Candidatus Levybacteria bacterium CG10_big_fil_rev_8_21_14_0_10_35_13]|nr:MAG: DUF1727 domain-containing protein [Candidatus Levybacteria bacterium CG10_big_fil_rev_8_21_14_0_10_35_13]
MINILLIFIGKFISSISRTFNLGNGSTWPGHIALSINKNFITDLLKTSKTNTILIIGTNGKTTTTKLLQTILEHTGKRVLINSSGANLLNGIASSLIIHALLNARIKKDFAIFEVDENVFPAAALFIKPDFVIALNLFRDQLDRYGEIDTISKKWKDSIKNLKNTNLILNSDDPQIAYLGKDVENVNYFGMESKSLENITLEHSSDSLLCPNCGKKLSFSAYYFSHLGKWKCDNCGFKRPSPDITHTPFYPIPGTHAMYDVLASVLLAKKLKISNKVIEKSLRSFKPAFGRQEIIVSNGRQIQFFLSKNPTSFNESLKTITSLNPKNLLILLNDRIPDGTDVSWIWDIDFEKLLEKNTKLYVSGDRVYDLALRLKYAGISRENYKTFENISDAINSGLTSTGANDTLYILPTYSAMLEARKILTGKKIL